jgi:hypothetical protein
MRRDGLKSAIWVVEQGCKQNRSLPSFGAPRKLLKFGFIMKFFSEGRFSFHEALFDVTGLTMYASIDLRAKLSLDGIFKFSYDDFINLITKASCEQWLIHSFANDVQRRLSFISRVKVYQQSLEKPKQAQRYLVYFLGNGFFNLLGILELYGPLRHHSYGLSGGCHSKVGLLFAHLFFYSLYFCAEEQRISA